VGEQDPERLAMLARSAEGRERVFAFGIGYDVNTHLLDRLSAVGRGSTEYVEPGESVEAAVGLLATKIKHPVLTDLQFGRQPVRLTEILPAPLPDLFAGEELVIFGRYESGRGGGEGTLEMTGMRNGRTERFALVAAFPAHETANDFVARLWASRKLGELDRQIRLEGRHPELIEEARQLALRHGLLSAYSSYLVLEPMETTMQEARRAFDVAGATAPPAAPAASGAAAVRVANQASRQRAVRSEADLKAVAEEMEASSPDVRDLAGRRFNLIDGVWTDATHEAGARTLRVEPFSALYFELLRALPELRPIWSSLEASLVAGEGMSVQVVSGGRDSLSAADLAGFVRSFRGS
jgi:Ca-activated chloride channel family protein